MSDTLSALIAFVGFLIVFSTLVQAFQESLKNLFKLKSGVWERFFLRLYKKEFSLEPATSTCFLKKMIDREFIGDYRTRMQKLKDIIITYDDTLHKIKTILYQIANASSDNAQFMNQLTPNTKILVDDIQKLSGLKLDSLLTIYDDLDKKNISTFSNNLQDFLKKSPNFGRAITSAEQSLVPLFQVSCKNLLTDIAVVDKKISDYRLQIENKFDDWMTQVDEEYRRNMLWWTVLIGFILVVLSNADTFSIYKYLSTDSKAQARIVQVAAESTSTVLTSKAEMLNEIDRQVKTKDFEKARISIITFSKTLGADLDKFGSKDDATSAKAIEEAAGKMKMNDPGASAKLKDEADELSRLYFVLQKASIDYQLKGVKSLELPLGWTDSYKEISALKGKALFLAMVKKLAGLFMTIFLITFGAPFWNDILNALTGLKKTAQATR